MSRPACQWPGQCAHKSVAPERAELDAAPDLLAEVRRLTHEAADLRRERDEARGERDELVELLAEIEEQPPVAWQSRFTDGGGWGYCSERHARMVAAAPHEWPGYEVRALIARPTPAAAPPHACPAPATAPELPVRCVECGQLGWHKMACSRVAHERGLRVTAHSSGSTSCPKRGGAA